jgi:hypothetical protein
MLDKLVTLIPDIQDKPQPITDVTKIGVTKCVFAEDKVVLKVLIMAFLQMIKD